MPTNILYPTKLFHDSEKLAIMDDFIERIEEISQVRTTQFDIQKFWQSKAPDYASSKSIYEFLETVKHKTLYSPRHSLLTCLPDA
jgi:hypothetical protein